MGDCRRHVTRERGARGWAPRSPCLRPVLPWSEMAATGCWDGGRGSDDKRARRRLRAAMVLQQSPTAALEAGVPMVGCRDSDARSWVHVTTPRTRRDPARRP